MATPKVYVICDQNCKYEGMTKEQILAAITQAVNEGTIGDCDTGFIQTIKTINGLPLRFFVGEQYSYDALSDEDKKDLFAIITNDTTTEGINNAISELQTNLYNLEKQCNEVFKDHYDLKADVQAVRYEQILLQESHETLVNGLESGTVVAKNAEIANRIIPTPTLNNGVTMPLTETGVYLVFFNGFAKINGEVDTTAQRSTIIAVLSLSTDTNSIITASDNADLLYRVHYSAADQCIKLENATISGTDSDRYWRSGTNNLITGYYKIADFH